MSGSESCLRAITIRAAGTRSGPLGRCAADGAPSSWTCSPTARGPLCCGRFSHPDGNGAAVSYRDLEAQRGHVPVAPRLRAALEPAIGAGSPCRIRMQQRGYSCTAQDRRQDGQWPLGTTPKNTRGERMSNTSTSWTHPWRWSRCTGAAQGGVAVVDGVRTRQTAGTTRALEKRER